MTDVELAKQFAESRIIPCQTNIHRSMAVRYAMDAALDMAEYKDKMNYEQLREHEKELYKQFITSISNLYGCDDEFFSTIFYNEVNDFKKLLKVYEPD